MDALLAADAPFFQYEAEKIVAAVSLELSSSRHRQMVIRPRRGIKWYELPSFCAQYKLMAQFY